MERLYLLLGTMALTLLVLPQPRHVGVAAFSPDRYNSGI